MERKSASDFTQELLNLYDRYVHGDMDRRAFLGGAKQFAAQGLAAAALFESLRPNYGRAEQIPKDDKRIKAEFVTVSSPQGNENIKRYPVRPANAAAKLPDVIVIHENRGAAAWHRELHGIRARWPDERRRVPGRQREERRVLRESRRHKMREDFVAPARWLKARPDWHREDWGGRNLFRREGM